MVTGLFLASALYPRASGKPMPKSPTASDATWQIPPLRADVEKLLMITEALWAMLKEKHGYSDEDLASRIEEIDMRDGVLDGKVAKQPPSTCPECSRKVTRARTNCIYCGAVLEQSAFGR